MKILISSNPDCLERELAKYKKTATVEAEYGNRVVEGNVITLAHHAEGWENNQPPCVVSFPLTSPLSDGLDAIGISHFDLDTLGGIIRLWSFEDETIWNFSNPRSDFWQLAAFIDTTGPHRINEWGRWSGDGIKDSWLKCEYHAWCAWSEANRLHAPRDGSVMDCTEFIRKAILTIKSIFAGDNDLLSWGGEWRKEQETLNKESLVEIYGDKIVLRRSDKFVNHLYDTLGNITYPIVIGYNTNTKAITISIENENVKIDCAKVMVEYFGDGAGGHSGIARTPRREEYSMVDVEAFAKWLNHRITPLKTI